MADIQKEKNKRIFFLFGKKRRHVPLFGGRGKNVAGQVIKLWDFQQLCHFEELQFLLGLLSEIATKSKSKEIL